MITTTLKDLRKHGACVSGYNKVVSALKGTPFDDRREGYLRLKHEGPINLLSILETNGLDDALWALRASDASDRDMRLFAVWCARQVEHLNTDPVVKACNDVAERFANGGATQEELRSAWAAAMAAARAAVEAAAWAAAMAAVEAAAWEASQYAAWDAARFATRSATWAAAWVAARFATRSATLSDQKEMFIKMCNGEAPWQIL